MNMRRGLSLFLSALVVTAGMSVRPANAVENTKLPQIRFAVPNHYPLYQGENQSVFVSTDFDGPVQYRAFVKDANGTWAQITEGYEEAVNGKVAVEIKDEDRTFKAGDNYIVIWVKRADQTGANVKTVKESEIPELGGQEVSYDTYKVVKVVAREGEATLNIEDLAINYDGLDVSVSGDEYYAIQALDVNDTWEAKAEYTQGSAERTFEAGQYLMDVWVDRDGNGYPDAYKLEYVELSEDAAEEVAIFTTSVKAAAFGATVNVTMTEDGKGMYANATQYQVFDGAKAVSAVTALGTGTTVYPAKAEGDVVTVKLVDANGAVVATNEVALGQSAMGTVEVEAPAEEAAVTATVKAAAFGATVTVNAENTTAVKYQIFDGAKAVSAVAELGTGTTVYPAKAAGETVTVKLLDANNAVVSTSEVVLAQ